MTEQETREAMKSHRWSFLPRNRRKRAYIYAARKVQGKREEVYICPFMALDQLTFDQLTEKLTGIVAASM